MSSTSRIKVLFVCTGNTCRSVFAEYIAREKFGGYFEASSAGFSPQPAEDADNAIFTLRNELDIDASGHQPQDVRKLNVDEWEKIVAINKWVASEFRESFPNFPLEKLIIWNISDPEGGNLVVYKKCALAVFKELSKWKEGLEHANNSGTD